MTLFVLSASTATAQSVVATSAGGILDWEDPMAWSFDLPPSMATIPDNDGIDFFDVRVDGGSSTNTEVSLSTAVVVDRLEIAPADSLFIGDSARLTIDSDISRVGSGQLVNDGVVVIDGATSLTRLDTGGALSISGVGTLRMTGAAELGTFSLFPPFITNQAGHRIEGSGAILQSLGNDGTISANSSETLLFVGGRLEQRGMLEATGAGGLDLRARGGVENTGTIRSLGSSISTVSMTNDGLIEVTQGGQFSVLADITNSGLIEITQGSEFVVSSLLTNEPTGRIVVSGAGSRLSALPLFNRGGTFEVLDGGRADFDGLVASGTIRIGGETSIIDAGVRVNVPGLLDLDGGTIQSDGGGMTVSSRGRVEGTGTIELGAGELRFEFTGALAPGGTNGTGRFDIFGDVIVASARSFGRPQIEIELGGTGEGDYDMISIEGTLSLSLFGSILVDLINLDDPTDPTKVFDPSVGSVFDILTASNIVDLGGTFTLPTFDDGREFTRNIVRVGSVDVLRLVVIPEPSTAVLLATGFILLASTKRCQQHERLRH